MCGRARCTLNRDDISAACGLHPSPKSLHAERFRPSYNVSPGAYMPVVRYQQEEGGNSPVIHYMKWGLVPSFTKKSEKPDHFRMFNARSESVHEKASFRRLLPKSRGLAIAEGFYEWKKDGSKKQPYYIHFRDGRPLVFAALYDCWTNNEGEELYTFTILTTCSSKLLEWLHDRMPVILGSKNAIDEWLNSDGSLPSLQSVMQPYGSEDLVWYPVNAAIGKVSFDGPECIKQIKFPMETKNTIISTLFGKQCSHPPMKSEDSAHGSLVKSPIEIKPKVEPKSPDPPILDEIELKAFLAATEPDEDLAVLTKRDTLEKEAMIKEDWEIKENISSTDIDGQSMEPAKKRSISSFETDARGIKKKRNLGDSHDEKVKGASTTAVDKQTSLLNFFVKQ